MATSAQLKALRQKYGLGEFSKSSAARLVKRDRIKGATKPAYTRTRTPGGTASKGGQVLAIGFSNAANQAASEIRLDQLEGLQQ